MLDYGLLGDVLMEQGRVDEAADAYQKMIDLKPCSQSYTRAAHLRWLKGDLDGAIELMRRVKSASPRDPSQWPGRYTHSRSTSCSAADCMASGARCGAAVLPDYAAGAARARARAACRSRAAEPRDAPRGRDARIRCPNTSGRSRTRSPRESDDEARPSNDELTATGARRDPRTLALFLATRGKRASKALALARTEIHNRRDIFTSTRSPGRCSRPVSTTRRTDAMSERSRKAPRRAPLPSRRGHRRSRWPTRGGRALVAQGAPRSAFTLLPSERRCSATNRTNRNQTGG